MPTELTLAEVADLVGGRVIGDPARVVRAVAPVQDAGEGAMALVASRRYARHLPDCGSDTFLVSEELVDDLPEGASAVAVSDAHAALCALLPRLVPSRVSAPAIHPSAVLGNGVKLGVDVSLGPYVVLEAGVAIGDGTRVDAHSVLGAGTRVGARCHLHAQVVTYEGTTIGDDVIVHSGARLGVDGFGYVLIDGEHTKIPQVGRCVIGDGVEIGANTTVDRGSLGDTHVGPGTKLDNLVHVAHNVRIGARSLLAALVGIAGSTRLGERVWMGGQSGAINHVDIGDGARVAVQAGVTKDVAPGETVSGFPARPHREELKRHAELDRLALLRADVSELSGRVGRLEGEDEREDEGARQG